MEDYDIKLSVNKGELADRAIDSYLEIKEVCKELGIDIGELLSPKNPE